MTDITIKVWEDLIGMRKSQGTIVLLLFALCMGIAHAVDVPQGWVRAKSNPNYAFLENNYQLGEDTYKTLSLMDLKLYEQGDYDKAVVDLVDSAVVSSINPVYDVSPDGSSVVFQVVARAGGGLLDSVIFMHIPESKKIQDLVLNNIFTDGISKKSEAEIYKLTDIAFKREKNTDLAVLSYKNGNEILDVSYDVLAACPVGLGDDLLAKVKAFYGGKLPSGVELIKKAATVDNYDQELVIDNVVGGIKHRFLFDEESNLIAFQEEDVNGAVQNFTKYFKYGSLVSSETYNHSGNKVFSSSSLDHYAYSAGDFAYFAYAKEAFKLVYDENLFRINHSYRGNLKASVGDTEARTRFLN